MEAGNMQYDSNDEFDISSPSRKAGARKSNTSFTPSGDRNTPKQSPSAALLPLVSRRPGGNIYGCDLCGQKFSIRSLLAAHKRAHDVGFQARIMQRKFIPTVEANHNRCIYCDRKFDLERTLHIHQMAYCPRITPKERRNLRFTELLHEGNATPLPKFNSEQQRPQQPSRGKPVAPITKQSERKLPQLPVLPVEMKPARSKLIPCYMCKESFETVKDLSDHTIDMHNNKKNKHRFMKEKMEDDDGVGESLSPTSSLSTPSTSSTSSSTVKWS